ncbi:MAG: Peptidase serine carboxypeptidase [Phycisphaerales bacterium]|nr:Peptidase serine carboxypeptidase [Phycisphaerales bacterium]
MHQSISARCLVAILLIAFPRVLLADPPQTQPKPQEHQAAEKLSVTEGQVIVNGEALKYKATAGPLVIKDEAGKAKAQMFFVAYEKQPADDAAHRPITFVFNGGPGAAAVWLHLGTAGPRRIALDEDGFAPAPPYHLEDNPNTWLAATDLVFIDPVNTGYSRPAEGEKPEQFFGLEEDIRSVGEFIRLYVTRNERWLSPKFLAGESYGTTRAAGLSQHLLESEGISLNGIILISSVLNFETISFGGGNELPYALYLPSYTAIAHYHKKLPPDLQKADLAKTLPDVEQFALRDYVAALAAGSALPADERKTIVAKLSRFTGLPQDYVEKSDLRIDPSAFRKELLADQRKVIGRFDARIAGYNPDPLGESADYDPSLPPYLAAYAATINDYVRRTLKYDSDLQYEVLSGRTHPWNFGKNGGGYVDVAPNLQDAMMKSPQMKVLFANGTADLATPYLAARYTIRHMNLSDALRANIRQNLYEGGHMIYHFHPSLEKLNTDVRAFIQGAVPKQPPAATQTTTAPAQGG